MVIWRNPDWTGCFTTRQHERFGASAWTGFEHDIRGASRLLGLGALARDVVYKIDLCGRGSTTLPRLASGSVTDATRSDTRRYTLWFKKEIKDKKFVVNKVPGTLHGERSYETRLPLDGNQADQREAYHSRCCNAVTSRSSRRVENDEATV